MRKGRDWLPVSSLKGIGVYYEDDLHDFALLMLKLKYARAAYEDTNLIPRPTVNGLAKKFAELIDVSYPDYGPVFAVIEKYDLPLGAPWIYSKLL
jgi:hypothetical protein